MQQVGFQRPSGLSGVHGGLAHVARAAPLSQPPALAQKSTSRTLLFVNRNWVNKNWILHRVAIIRVFAALLLALVLAAGFQARGGIGLALQTSGDLLAGRFAQAGFAIREITISGQAMALESDIAAALDLNGTTNVFNFDVDAARQRLLELPAIADVQVRKVYPSQLVVKVSEVVPVARWRVDGVTFVIDASGNQIADATIADDGLPLVIGDGAANDALAIIQALKNYPVLGRGLAALSRIGDRRWDMIYETGLRVRLPERGLGAALENLNRAQGEKQLLDRDLVSIDLRVAGLMALRPAQRQQQEPEH